MKDKLHLNLKGKNLTSNEEPATGPGVKGPVVKILASD